MRLYVSVDFGVCRKTEKQLPSAFAHEPSWAWVQRYREQRHAIDVRQAKLEVGKRQKQMTC